MLLFVVPAVLAGEPFAVKDWKALDTCYASGLRSSIFEAHDLPIVTVTMVVGAGAADDPTGFEGTADLVEHLAFRGHDDGTARDAALDAMGGRWNATTHADVTVYSALVPAASLDRVLRVFGGILADPLAGVTAEEERAEREVVVNELRFRRGDATVGIGELVRALFGPGHPYHGLGSDTAASVRGVPHADLVAWTHAHYRPELTTITISGDVEANSVPPRVVDLLPLPLVAVPSDQPTRRCTAHGAATPVDPPPPATLETVHTEHVGTRTEVTVAWAIPGGPVDVLARTAAGELDFRIRGATRRLLAPGAVQPAVSCGITPGALAGVLACTSSTSEPDDPRVLLDGLVAGAEDTVGDSRTLYAGFLNALQTEFYRHAAQMGDPWMPESEELPVANHLSGDPLAILGDFVRAQTVNPHDIDVWEDRWLAKDRMVSVVSTPRAPTAVEAEPTAVGATTAAAPIDASIEGLLRVPLADRSRTETLDNGLGVTAVRWGELPRVAVALVARGGVGREPTPGVDALAWFEHDIRPRGNQIGPWKLLYDRGIDIVENDGADSARIELVAPADSVLDVVRAVRAIAGGIVAEASARGRYREAMARSLAEGRREPAAWLEPLSVRALFPGHPITREAFPDDAIVAALRRSRPAPWLRSVWQPGNTRLIVVGAIDPDAVLAEARQDFAEWEGRGIAPGAVAPPPSPPSRSGWFVPDDATKPAELRVACALDPGASDGAVAVARGLLTGSLVDEWRRRRPLVYTPFATVRSVEGGTRILAADAEIRPGDVGVAMGTGLGALRAIAGVEDGASFEAARVRAAVGLLADIRTPEGLLAELARADGGVEGLAARIGELGTVSAKDVRAAMGRCVDHEVVLVSGPEGAIGDAWAAAGVVPTRLDPAAERMRLWSQVDADGAAVAAKREGAGR